MEENVSRLKLSDGREVILVGTAHVSRASAEQVERIIEEEQPDTVCVELCSARLEKIQNPESWKETDLLTIIKRGELMLLVINLMLSSYQKKIAEKFKIRPGEEMLRSITSAEKHGAKLEVIDRNVKTTLKRTWGFMTLKSKFGFMVDILGWSGVLLMVLFPVLLMAKLLWPDVISGTMVAAAFVAMMVLPVLFAEKEEEEVTEETLEKMKEGDTLETMLQEMGSSVPDIKKRLIDERDLYMVERLRQTAGPKTVAVVGAGHVPGMKKQWETEVDLQELDRQPKAKLSGQFLQWLLPGSIILMGVALAFTGGWDEIRKYLVEYILYTGGGAALGCLICLAHPLTIAAAFVAAPFTVLHPALGVGMFTALTECYFRKPKVGDFETVMDDFSHWRKWFSNRVLHLFLVSTLSSLGTIAALYTFLTNHPELKSLFFGGK